jgi:hypothetical protein
MNFNTDDEYLQSSSLPLLYVPSLIAATCVVLPSAVKIIGEVGGQLWSGLSFLGQIAQEEFQQNAPQSVKNVTTNLLMISEKVLVCAEEMLDFANFGGTKDVSASIATSRQRIALHDQPFADCCDFIADQAAQAYLQNANSIKEKVPELLKDYLHKPRGTYTLSEVPKAIFNEYISDGIGWFVGFSEDLLAQTVKANVLHLLANLVDQAYDAKHPFADQQRNPFGRILTLLGVCVMDYEKKLLDIEKSPKDSQDDQYHQLFQEMSTSLLAKLFPHGASDVQLFHHTVPVKLLKEKVWEMIQKSLPTLLERFYHETRPLSHEHPNWEEEFKEVSGGLEADQFIKLPSFLFEHFIRSDGGQLIDSLESPLEKSLQDKKVNNAGLVSQLMVRHLKELLLTRDPILLKMGSFFEKNFMERVLFNLSEFIPDTVDKPLPLYLLERCLPGDFFNMVQGCLTKSSAVPGFSSKAIANLLEPFGFNKEETFPLPPSIRKLVWTSILSFQQEDLPQLIEQAIPEWTALSQRKQNEDNLTQLLQDDSLAKTFQHLSDEIIEPAIKWATKISIGQQLNTLLPSHPLSATQQKELDNQWNSLLGTKNDVLDGMNDFGRKMLEGLLFQLFRDLSENYAESSYGLESLFEEKEEEDRVTSFPGWLMQQVTLGCERLSLEEMSEEELENLQKAIVLKNTIQNAKDPQSVLNETYELEKLWPALEPKFAHLSQHLLNVFGYDNPRKLPVPKQLKPILWKMLISALPKLLFEHTSDFILPILEREKLQKQIEKQPHGHLITKGCQVLARDFVEHLPKWVDNKIEGIPDDLEALVPQLSLTDQSKDYITNALRAFINQDEPAFEPFWQWIESYLEGILLKMADSLNQKSQADLTKIQELVQTTREKLLAVEQGELEDQDLTLEEQEDEILFEEDLPLDEQAPDEDAEAILIKFTEELFECIGVEMEGDLFGVPSMIGRPLVLKIKKTFAQGFLDIYRLDHQIRHAAPTNPVEKVLSTSEVANAALSLTRYAMDRVTDALAKGVGEQTEGIVQLYNPLKVWLGKKAQEGYQIAGVFQEVVDQQLPTPFLKSLFHLLDADDVKPYKQQLADWINPLLTDKLIGALAPLLKKEQKGQADFDQALLLALLPVLTNHLKNLNLASAMDGGVNLVNFEKVAESELSVDAVISEDEGVLDEDSKREKLQQLDPFYKKQTDLIFELIFPNGKEDLITIIPGLNLTPEQLEPAWEGAKNEVASQLPKVIESLFDQEMLIDMFNALFETIIENLDETIVVKQSEKKALSEEEKANERQMDRLVGELVIEGLKFVDLPIDRLEKLPNWMKRIIGLKGIEQSTSESIGASMRQQFNGELLAKSLKSVLAKLAKQQHVKMTGDEKVKEKENAFQHLKDLERQIARKGIAYVFRWIEAHIRHATDIFGDSIFNSIREALLAIFSFVMVRLVAGALRLFKIERLVVDVLHAFLRHSREKFITVFSQPKLHEKLVFNGVEAFENVLTDQTV